MAGRKGSGGAGAVQAERTKQEEPVEEESTVASNQSEDASKDSNDEQLSNGESTTEGGTTTTTTTTTDSGSADSEPGIKPSEKELLEETKRNKEEQAKLKLALVEEKLELIDKRLADIAQDNDGTLNGQIEAAQGDRDRKLAVARERYRLQTDSITEEFTATSIGLDEELRNAKVEIGLAQEAKYHFKAAHHTVKPMGERATAGQELPLYVECQLSREQIEDDLSRINGPVSPSRKHSLASASPSELVGEQEPGSKARRKSR